MGGDNVTTGTTGKQINAVIRGLPKWLQATGENIGPFEQALVNARGVVDPQNSALDESLLRYFGPRFNEIGIGLQGQQALGQASNELSVLQGPGTQLARTGQALNEEIDPQYYGLRDVAGKKFVDLLAGQDPNRLTGSEMANVERGLNRTNRMNGMSDVHSSGGAISNAMTFGHELDRKRNTLVNTLSQVPGNLAAMKSGFDSFKVATGRDSSTNPGFAQYGTGRQGFGQNVTGMSQGLLGESGQNARQTQSLTANARDSLDRVTQVMGSLPSC